uniref:Uncharacterized protein n=1 Tax=Chrysotila carterae TaxID=13221 RepID=A0A7S4F9S2_CHRCT|mmetsp:Transcript_59058/g.128216  ORF Transcript_59058/g.128216 Transcript_59058/m.128216 type:complete len:122 (+) Transcript_59058:625-990(+)
MDLAREKQRMKETAMSLAREEREKELQFQAAIDKAAKEAVVAAASAAAADIKKSKSRRNEAARVHQQAGSSFIKKSDMPFSRACGSVERETCLVDAFFNALRMLGVTASLSKLRDVAIVGE